MIAKLTSPRLHGPVERERLFSLLDRRDAHPIVWIAGPPGAGKTTLVVSYLRVRGVRSHWYQVDGGDADPAALFLYLGELAKSFGHRGVRSALPYFTPEYRDDLPGFARRYFRDFFERMRPGDVLVLDNCHECAGTDFDEVLRAAGAELPEGIGLIAISRAQLPSSLAREKSAGRVLELGWEQLRLTAQETEQVVAAAGVDGVEATRLHCQADGWVAGLTLLVANLERGPAIHASMDLRSKEAVFDYFAGEVFDRAPAATRDLLMRTSLLPEMTPEMAAAISGNPEAGKVLDRLYRRHYFTSRKGEPHLTYQYHDLFRAFLVNRLEAELNNESLRQVCESSARVLEQTGRPDAAGDVLCRGRLWGALAALLERIGDALLDQGRWQTILTWLYDADEQSIHGDPRLGYWKGMATVPQAPDQALPWLAEAVAGFEASGQSMEQLRAVCGVCEAIYYRYTDFKALDEWVPLLERLIAEPSIQDDAPLEARALIARIQAVYLRGPTMMAVDPLADRLIQLLRQGLPAGQTVEFGTRLLAVLAQMGDSDRSQSVFGLVDPQAHLTSIPPLRMAWWERAVGFMEVMRGEVESALEHCDTAIAIAREQGFTKVLVQSATTRMYVQRWQGDAIDTLQAMCSEVERACDERRPNMVAWRGRAQNILAEARGDPVGWLAVRRSGEEVSDATGVIAWSAMFDIFGALAVSESGREEEALSLCRATRERMNSVGFWRMGCWQGLVEARVLIRLGRHAEAAERLGETLRLVARCGALGFVGFSFRDLPWLMNFALLHDIETATALRIIRHYGLAGPAEAGYWPWPIRIRALGPLTLAFDANARPETQKKSSHRLLDLLKALICLGPKVTTERLAEALWPDADGDQAQGNLSSSVHRLRKLLGREDAIVQRDGKVSLNDRVCWVDAHAFETLAEHVIGPDTPLEGPALHRAGRAHELYRGHLFAGESHGWMTAARERLRQRYQCLSLALGSAQEAAGDTPGALAIYERMVELTPGSELAYRRLMQCLAREGRVAEARDVFQRCRRVLSSTLGTSPSAETVAVFESLEDTVPSRSRVVAGRA